METSQLEALAPNPKNPRKITPEKIEMLRAALTRFGDLSGIVFNRRSGQLVGGHQRKEAFQGGQITVERRFSEPSRAGTVAEGFVLFEGERYAYREVDWDAETDLAANIAANKGAGDWDYSLLTEALNHLDHHNYDLSLTMHDAAELDRIMGGWDSDISKVEKTEEHLDGIDGKIVIICPQELKDEVLIFLKAKFLETSFDGLHIK